MRAKDLDLRELLDFESQEGLIRFAGQRALIVDAVALGLLRQELIATVGMAAARGIFTRFGFAHGWRTAETMREAFPWDSEQDWRRAGGRLHTLQGLVLFEPVSHEPGDPSAPFAEATWRHSYEAEQHLLHHGQADEPVCWTLTGFASGYLSFTNGRKILCLEDRCVGKGDATCHMIGKSREEWGEAVEQVVPFYEKGCDAVLEKTTSALRQAEQQLRARRKELARVGAKDEERSGMTVRSDAMKRVMELAGRVARSTPPC
jgi:two-component system, NtrC family, response regulator HydG